MKATTPDRLGALLFELMTTIGQRSDGEFFALIADSGLTPLQLRALRLLADPGATLGVSELADELGCSLPTASRVAKALVCAGYLTAGACPSDRRARRLTVTPAGLDLTARLRAAKTADFTAFAAQLTGAQRDQLAGALTTLDLPTSR